MITVQNINLPLNKILTIKVQKKLGVTAFVWLHEIARKLEEYNIPVDCWQVGKDAAGNEIKIDRLGRFLFGVPGYDGHLRIVTNGPEVTIHYPSEPVEAEVLMNRIKSEVEKRGSNEQ